MNWTTLSLLIFTGLPLAAAEFTIHIVDGLGRPVSGARLTVSCDRKQGTYTQLAFVASRDGVVHGIYDESTCTPTFVDIEKEGYQSYSTGFRDRYVLQHVMSVQEIPRIARLAGDELRTELGELLAGQVDDHRQFDNLVFFYEKELRPALHDLARIPEITVRARQILSTIAAPEDLHLIMQLEPPPASGVFADRWRYQVATALVNPDSEEEWSFLRRCAVDEFQDRWVDAGAIQTLKLTASERSRSILEEAKQKNPTRAAMIDRAIAYIQSNPPPLANADLEVLAKAVAEAIKIGEWKGNATPRYNAAGDKALIDFTFRTSEDVYRYTATFHRIEGRWALRGAHESYQAFAPQTTFHIQQR